MKEGDFIKKGEPLFSIDNSELKQKIRLQKEKIKLSKINAKKYKDIYDILKKLWNKKNGLISKRDYKKALDDYLFAKESYDYEVEKLKILNEKLLFYTVKSPIDGVVLKNILKEGMYMEATSSNPAYLIIGSKDFNLIALVDELMAYKIKKGAKGVAFVRGEPNKKVKLEFSYIRPLIEQKNIFLNTPLQRSNAKVLQVVYKVKKSSIPLYAGEIFDVYIEVK